MFRVSVTFAASEVFANTGYLHNAGEPIDFDTIEEARAAARDFARDYARPGVDVVEVVKVSTVAAMTPEEFFAKAKAAGLPV